MQGFNRVRPRERENAPRGFLSMGRVGVLIAVSWLTGSVGAMAQEPVLTEPVVVTATRIEEKVSEQASSVSVVTREDMEQLSPSLAGDVLQRIPGVDVQRTGSLGGLENIKIRGGKSTHTLVMIDGFPVNSPSSGEFDISALPVDGFERVEVVRGAQSALYGSNAMSGVVNFLPRKGEEGRKYGAGLSGGSFSTLQWSGFGEGAGKGRNFHLGVSGLKSNGILPNDDTDLLSFVGSGEAAVGERNRVYLVALSTDEERGIPIDDRGPDPVARRKRRNFLGGLRWETAVSRSVHLSASGAEFEEDLHVSEPPDPSLFGSSDFQVKTRKTLVRVEGSLSASPVSTTFLGFQFVKDRAQNDAVFRSPPFPDFVTDVTASTYNRSYFLQEELRFHKRTGVSLGARLDDNSEAGTKVNPKVAVFHQFDRIDVTLRSAYGRGFRVPTIVEKFDPTSGNPDLSPETVISYEAGADFRPKGTRAVVSATYFYQDFRELIQQGPPTTGHPFGQLQNVGGAFSRGVEAQATWWFHAAVGAEVSYTYTDTGTRDASPAIAAITKRILGIPQQRGTASLLLSPSPRLRARIDWRLESDQFEFGPKDFLPGRRPGNAVVNAYARYAWEPVGADVRKLALTLKVQNLLNRDYEERKGFPSPGINFLLGVEVTI
ncbi:TonB-dependent receptor [Candidatus Deferrimicrobium sp.]|uniref:TonB-dependent receptor plug domain-containing protein n=1 Tax=Candidatus Deferrimicrobium sp. TaxID=3060586 RepID=UPI002ED6AC11